MAGIDRVVFQSVRIKDFRGFRDLQQLELSASAVLVVGSNGTGKTSFFDALQWLLIGDIPRLRDHASRRKAEFIVNQWSSNGIAEVSAELLIDNHNVQVRRSGSSSASELEVQDHSGLFAGEEGQRKLDSLLLVQNGAGLREALPATGLLQQDILRSVIEGEPTQRYQRLTRLLGLEGLPKFEQSTRSQADALRREATTIRSELDRREVELRDAEAQVQKLSAQLLATPSIKEIQQGIVMSLKDNAPALQIVAGFPTDANDLSRLGNAARRFRDQAAELLSIKRELDVEVPDVEETTSRWRSSRDFADSLGLELRATEEDLSEAVRTLEDAERNSEQLSALASYALPLLNDLCPVCRQPIEIDEVRKRLNQLVEQGGRNLTTLREELESVKKRFDSLEVHWRQACLDRDSLAGQMAKAIRLDEERQDWLAKCAAFVGSSESLKPVDGLGIRDGSSLALDEVWRSAVEIERATRDAMAMLSAQDSTRTLEEARSRSNELGIEANRLREAVTNANKRASEARKVAHVTAQAVAKVAGQRLETLAPLLSEVYSRFDPHPAFTSLDYDLELYRMRAAADPVVIDDQLGNRADPVLVFSSSQVNVVALTFFLAMSWTDGAYSLPFILLDDPLQAMDDINALGFADLCRHIRTKRQLVISTHDRRLRDLLERKLAPREVDERTQVLHFVGWDRSGPQIEQYGVEPQLEAGEKRILMAA